ncbi:MAG: hypothetical protein GEU79_02010 [Acidimicrobiia bacterium]|nr:hypothetical protein [Acidimicrobiia bacterium]
MDITAWALIAVAAVAIAAAGGAFVVAFRRSSPDPDPTSGVSPETLRVDRSKAGVRLEPIEAGTPAPETSTELEPVIEEAEEPPLPATVDADAVELV